MLILKLYILKHILYLIMDSNSQISKKPKTPQKHDSSHEMEILIPSSEMQLNMDLVKEISKKKKESKKSNSSNKAENGYVNENSSGKNPFELIDEKKLMEERCKTGVPGHTIMEEFKTRLEKSNSKLKEVYSFINKGENVKALKSCIEVKLSQGYSCIHDQFLFNVKNELIEMKFKRIRDVKVKCKLLAAEIQFNLGNYYDYLKEANDVFVKLGFK